jgi:hypothetical protein
MLQEDVTARAYDDRGGRYARLSRQDVLQQSGQRQRIEHSRQERHVHVHVGSMCIQTAVGICIMGSVAFPCHGLNRRSAGRQAWS